MFFRKCDKKRRHPCLTLLVTALSAIGVFSVWSSSKKTCLGMMGKMKQWLGKAKADEGGAGEGD